MEQNLGQKARFPTGTSKVMGCRWIRVQEAGRPAQDCEKIKRRLGATAMID